MSICELKFGFPPTVNTYYRAVTIKGVLRMLLSKPGRLYKMQCAATCAEVGTLNMGYLGPVELWCYFAPPDKRKRDLDNLLKPVLDSLQYAGVIVDDSQIVAIHAYRGTPDKEKEGSVTVCLVAADSKEVEEVADTDIFGTDALG